MLVDSNVLVYALNIDSPKNLAARKFLLKCNGNFCVAQQNIFETLRIVTHQKFPKPMPISQAVTEVNNIVGVGYVINPNPETLQLAMKLLKRYHISGKKIFDGYLVATMVANGESVIATDNEADFAQFAGIKVINLFAKS